MDLINYKLALFIKKEKAFLLGLLTLIGTWTAERFYNDSQGDLSEDIAYDRYLQHSNQMRNLELLVLTIGKDLPDSLTKENQPLFISIVARRIAKSVRYHKSMLSAIYQLYKIDGVHSLNKMEDSLNLSSIAVSDRYNSSIWARDNGDTVAAIRCYQELDYIIAETTYKFDEVTQLMENRGNFTYFEAARKSTRIKILLYLFYFGGTVLLIVPVAKKYVVKKEQLIEN